MVRGSWSSPKRATTKSRGSGKDRSSRNDHFEIIVVAWDCIL